jgi:hypothetical protein
MAKKFASTIVCVLKKQVEPITGKWYTDKAIDTLDHHPGQGKIKTLKWRSMSAAVTSGGLDTLKVQDAQQKCDCGDTLVTVDRKSLKRPRRQPVTRNRDFLWTDIKKY